MYTISIHFVQFAGETSVLSRTEQCCSIDLTCFSRSIQYTFSCFIQCNESLTFDPCSTVLFAYIAAHIYSSYLGFQFEVDAFNAIPSNMKTYKPCMFAFTILPSRFSRHSTASVQLFHFILKCRCLKTVWSNTVHF